MATHEDIERLEHEAHQAREPSAAQRALDELNAIVKVVEDSLAHATEAPVRQHLERLHAAAVSSLARVRERVQNLGSMPRIPASGQEMLQALGAGFSTLVKGISTAASVLGGEALRLRGPLPTSMVHCGCGAPIAQGQRFCGACGKPVVAGRRCPACNTALENTAKFCPQCGKPSGGEIVEP